MTKLPARYSKVLKTLDGGGMSKPLLCEDAHLQRKVVVKSLISGGNKKHLMDELSALSAIRSKYVVQVYDVLWDGAEIIGFVEEFIDGANLTPLGKPLDVKKALKILYQMFAGVADVHAQHRLHRDIKPDNMKLDNNGTLKLFDFGLAKLDTSAKTSVLYCTIGYAAPENFQKDASGHHNFTPAVDVFSLGASALWLLDSGTLPPGLLNIPLTLPCADFGIFGLPPKIADVLNATLAEDPKARPDAARVRDQIARELLFDRHRMLLTLGAQEYHLNNTNRQVKLTAGSDAVTIYYDGYDFRVTAVNGTPKYNNRHLKVGDILRGAAVIVMGGSAVSFPTSLTADVSQPEVML